MLTAGVRVDASMYARNALRKLCSQCIHESSKHKPRMLRGALTLQIDVTL